MTDKPGAIIQNAEQDRGPPLAARGEHLPRAVVTIPVPQAIDVRGRVAANLAVEQSRFGALGACGLARCHPTALVETVRLHEAAQGVVAGQRLQIVSRLGERDEIVVMKLDAPALVRGILRRTTWRTASLIAGCWPASVRSLRRKTPTGSRRSFKAR